MATGWKLVIGSKRYSSWSLRPWLVLKHAGLSFEEISVALRQPTTKHDIAQLSPSGKVPVLITPEVTVWESLAICEYVAEVLPELQLWPADRSERAHARAICHEMHAGFSNLRSHMPMDVCERHPIVDRVPEVAADVARIEEIWHDCRNRYGSKGDFLFGTFSIADAMYAPVVTRFRTYDTAVTSTSHHYMDTILALPAVQQWIAGASASG